MFLAIAGQSNRLTLPAVARASGNPIVSGTVNLYLKALDGDNAGKWWQGSDGTWQATLVVGAVAEYEGDDGIWGADFASEIWVAENRYLLYLKESDNLHIPVQENVICTVDLHDGLTEDQQAQVDHIESKTNLLGAGTIALTPAVQLPGPTVTIVIGDSYGQTNGRPALILIDEDDQWPSNVGDGLIVFSVKKFAREVELSVVATLIEVDGHKAASIALTSAQTSGLSYAPNHKYDLRVNWDSGDNMALIDPQQPCEVELPVTPVGSSGQ